LGIKKHIEKLDKTQKMTLDLSNCNVVDHTVMDNILHTQADFENQGGELILIGLLDLHPTSKSNHEMSTRKKDKSDRLDHIGNPKIK
jgi:MFS superfamily sulfate permease-like transporter